MKNAILLLLIFATISCKKENPETPAKPVAEETSDTIASFRAGYKTLLVVNRAVATLFDPNWVQKNIDVLDDHDPGTTDVYVDLSKIPSDGYHIEKARWLKENMTVIDYDKSKDAILGEHRLTGFSSTQSPIKEMSLQHIINMINQNGADHYKDRVYSYIYLSGDSNANFSIVHKDTFEPGKNYYSIPLLKAIEKHYTTGKNTRFTFYSYNGSIIFKVNDSHFYNFSHFPKKKDHDNSVI